jgi:hypothetical protein
MHLKSLQETLLTPNPKELVEFFFKCTYKVLASRADGGTLKGAFSPLEWTNHSCWFMKETFYLVLLPSLMHFPHEDPNTQYLLELLLRPPFIVLLLFHLGTSISRPGPVRPSRSWNQDRHLDGQTDGQTPCCNYIRDICKVTLSSILCFDPYPLFNPLLWPPIHSLSSICKVRKFY